MPAPHRAVDAERISALGRSALDWLAVNRDHLLGPTSDKLTARTAKPLGELALLLSCLARTGSGVVSPTDPSFVKLVDVVEAAGQLPSVKFRPARSSWIVVLRAAMFCVLDTVGRRDAECHGNAVQNALVAGVLDNVEAFPYQLMEMRLLLDWGGFPHDLPAWAKLAARSLLPRRIQALYLTEQTAYQLTHDIMFLSRLDPSQGVPPDTFNLARCRQVLSDLLLYYAMESHWDLVGELLFCWDCLRLPQDHISTQVWALLLSQQAPDGSFPGPRSRAAADPEPADSSAWFRHRYHTTLVVILALHGRVRQASLPCEAGEAVRAARRGRTARSADMAAAVRRDAGWLRGLLEGRAGLSDPLICCGVLVGTWLCAAIDPAIGVTLPTIASHVANELVAGGRFDVVPPALALTAHALLQRVGFTVPALAAFVNRVRDVLAVHPPVSAATDLALCEKRVLLAQLGLAEQPPHMPQTLLRQIVAKLPAVATSDHLAALLLAAGSATGYGTTDLEPDAGGDTSDVMLGYAIRQFRMSDLDIGCALVRSANCLSQVSDDRAVELVNFLLLQQRPDGGYGLLLDRADCYGERDGTPTFDIEREFYLSTTLTCLWTLAELHADFRLYRSIRNVA